MSLTISDLLKYKNEHVLTRYKMDYPQNTLIAEEALEELMKYLWLTHQHELDKQRCPENEALVFVCAIHEEMKEIDDMWHTFLLFTKDYMMFCHQYFGRYCHHSPTTTEEKLVDSEFETDFSRYLSYIYDHLGENTLIKWFGPLLH